ncbi:MAG: tRNA dihydrouridine synthase DusB [Clostridia bacterium]
MKKDCNIGNVRLANPFLLAPLAGVTDAPFRRICGEMGAGLVYSEMVSAKGLWYKDKNTDRLLEILDGEAPVAYQIFGHEPEIIAEAVHMLNERKHVLLDINMGCPVPKIVRNGEGSALMRDPDLAQRVVEAAVSASTKPVTVKIRAGWNDAEKNAVEVARAIEAGGASAVAVHGRTREQFYSGNADWNIIAAVKDAVRIPVIGNGDVTDVTAAYRMMQETDCDFVMIGRGALGNPWIFESLARAWAAGVCDALRPEAQGSEANQQGAAGAQPAAQDADLNWQGAADARAAAQAADLVQPDGPQDAACTQPAHPAADARLQDYDCAPSKEQKIAMMLRHFDDVYALKGEYTAVREMRKHVGWYLKGVPGTAAFRGRINQINDAAALRAAIRSI